MVGREWGEGWAMGSWKGWSGGCGGGEQNGGRGKRWMENRGEDGWRRGWVENVEGEMDRSEGMENKGPKHQTPLTFGPSFFFSAAPAAGRASALPTFLPSCKVAFFHTYFAVLWVAFLLAFLYMLPSIAFHFLFSFCFIIFPSTLPTPSLLSSPLPPIFSSPPPPTLSSPYGKLSQIAAGFSKCRFACQVLID